MKRKEIQIIIEEHHNGGLIAHSPSHQGTVVQADTVGGCITELGKTILAIEKSQTESK